MHQYAIDIGIEDVLVFPVPSIVHHRQINRFDGEVMHRMPPAAYFLRIFSLPPRDGPIGHERIRPLGAKVYDGTKRNEVFGNRFYGKRIMG